MSQLHKHSRVASVCAAALLLAGCGGGGSGDENTASTGELRTFTYEDTIDPELLDPFKAEHPGLDVRTATFESLDEAAAKITSGFSTDVIEVCLDEAAPLLADDLLAPIDTSKLSNWNDLSPTFRDADGVTVDGNVVMVPVSSGPHGIIYTTEAFPDGVDSYTALFDPANAGKVALDGGWLTALSDAALASGITDPISMTDTQVEQMKDKILAAKGQFRTIAGSDSDMANLFKSGEVVLADGGRGTAQQINEGGGAVTWVAPKEGTLSWVCGLGISADAENVDAAYSLIDYYISKPAQAITGDLGYVITNPTALSEVSEEYRETADPAAVKGTIPQVEPKNAEVWRSAWQEIEAGG
ncbi:ABC transporter substrate-binding protein [Mycobacterium sp. TJFP1]|jgi:spermidine/putrescine-binding protein